MTSKKGQMNNAKVNLTIPCSINGQNDTRNIIIEGSLESPPETLRYLDDIPEMDLRAYYDDPERTHILHFKPQMLFTGLTDVPFGIMDSISAELGEIAYLLFEKMQAPAGNVLLIDPDGEAHPNPDIFKDGFNLDGLIKGVVSVCNTLMQHPQRRATYFVYLGCANSKWPMDYSWKTAFEKRGFLVERPYNGVYGAFYAIKPIPDPAVDKSIVILSEGKFYRLTAEEMVTCAKRLAEEKEWEKRRIQREKEAAWEKYIHSKKAKELPYPENLLINMLSADEGEAYQQSSKDKQEGCLGLLLSQVSTLPEAQRKAVEFYYRDRKHIPQWEQPKGNAYSLLYAEQNRGKKLLHKAIRQILSPIRE